MNMMNLRAYYFWGMHATVQFRIFSIPVCCIKTQSCYFAFETWSRILREGHMLSVFENRMLKKIFGLKRGKEWEAGKSLNEELHDLYSSANIIQVIK
jgi:hypothetical protein